LNSFDEFNLSNDAKIVLELVEANSNKIMISKKVDELKYAFTKHDGNHIIMGLIAPVHHFPFRHKSPSTFFVIIGRQPIVYLHREFREFVEWFKQWINALTVETRR
jgi:hypothetical protein